MRYFDQSGIEHELVTLSSTGSYAGYDSIRLEFLELIKTPKEGHFIAYKEGKFKWVPIPPNFKDYTDKL
jgi:hypothetical protein